MTLLSTPPRTPLRAAAGSKKHDGSGGGLRASVNSLWQKVTKKLATGSGGKPAKPKQLLATIGGKKKAAAGNQGVIDGGEDFGDGGLWQRSIMMGDKCQPLDFSGVIYYDVYGNRTPEMPMKSPCASPFRSYLQRSSPKP